MTALSFLVPLLLALAPQGTTAGAFDPAHCRAVVVGVLEWQSRDFAPFSKEERQDERFARTLRERGVPPENVTLLLDRAATRAAIEASLADAAAKAGPDGTLLFYYAGHGTRSGASGCFANWDMTGAADGLEIGRIGAIVATRFTGRRVLLFADCCYSGLLADVVARIAQAGFDAACATSVVAESSSTGNWTFTQTLIEALSGDPALDTDGDGRIEWRELGGSVRAAMAWRESQRSGAAAAGIGPDFDFAPVVATAAAARLRAAHGERPPVFALGDHVRLLGPREAVARVVGLAEDDQLMVRRYAYATHEDVTVAATAIAPIEVGMMALDRVVGVRLGPDRVAARVVALDPPFHRVVYPAWPELPGEWKLATQFGAVPDDFDPATGRRLDGAATCMVEWKGGWYPALVLSFA